MRTMQKLLGSLDVKMAPAQADLMPIDSGYGVDASGWTRIRSMPDTGAFLSVLRPDSIVSGYHVTPSAMSRKGQSFVSASHGEIANEGQVVLPTMSTEGVSTTQTWQVAEVSKKLLSITEECDKNQLVMFGRTGGIIMSLETGDMRRFGRDQQGYTMEHWIPPPSQLASGFPWQSS